MLMIAYETGPKAGQKEPTPSVDPSEFLGSLVNEDIGWSLDFDQATRDEVSKWGVADFGYRIARAYRRKKPICIRFITDQEKHRFTVILQHISDSGGTLEVAKESEEEITLDIIYERNKDHQADVALCRKIAPAILGSQSLCIRFNGDKGFFLFQQFVEASVGGHMRWESDEEEGIVCRVSPHADEKFD